MGKGGSEPTFKLDFNFEHITSEKNNININIRSRYGIEESLTDYMAPSFPFHTLRHDLFPYFSFKSATMTMIVLQLLALCLLPPQYKIMRFSLPESPGAASSPLQSSNHFMTALLFCPFNVTDMPASMLALHIVFCLSVVAELEFKLGHGHGDGQPHTLENRCSQAPGKGHDRWKSSKSRMGASDGLRLSGCLTFLWIVLTATSLANLIALSLFPTLYALSSNAGLYALYVYLQYRDLLQKQAMQQSMREQNNSEQYHLEGSSEGSDQLVTVYKCLLLSYLVYIAEIGGKYGHFGCYLVAIVLLLGLERGSKELPKYLAASSTLRRTMGRSLGNIHSSSSFI